MIERRVYRSRSTRGLAVLLTFVFLMILIGGIAGLSSEARVGGIVSIGVASAGLAWSWLWFAQMGVTSTDQGVIIRNWVRRFYFPWGAIDSFNFGNDVDNLSLREQFSSPVLQTYVVLRDGRHQLMCGLSVTRVHRSESRRRVQQLLDDLERDRISRSPQEKSTR